MLRHGCAGALRGCAGLLGEGDAPAPVPEPSEVPKARKRTAEAGDEADGATAASYRNVSGGGPNVLQSPIHTIPNLANQAPEAAWSAPKYSARWLCRVDFHARRPRRIHTPK